MTVLFNPSGKKAKTVEKHRKKKREKMKERKSKGRNESHNLDLVPVGLHYSNPKLHEGFR
jgi:hypothetical protein